VPDHSQNGSAAIASRTNGEGGPEHRAPTGGSETAYVGLGTNLGDRLANLHSAVAELRALDGVEFPHVGWASRLYETSPVPAEPSAPVFLNAVVRIYTRLGPVCLLEKLHMIERRLGRRRTRLRGAPRTIDLDLLLYGAMLIRRSRLHVPHPRLAERRFVLEPLTDLCPDLEDPESGVTIQHLAAQCRARHPEQVVRLGLGRWP